MNSFRTARLSDLAIPQRPVTALTDIAAAQGRQALYGKQTPQVLKALREIRIIEPYRRRHRRAGAEAGHADSGRERARAGFPVHPPVC